MDYRRVSYILQFHRVYPTHVGHTLYRCMTFYYILHMNSSIIFGFPTSRYRQYTPILWITRSIITVQIYSILRAHAQKTISLIYVAFDFSHSSASLYSSVLISISSSVAIPLSIIRCSMARTIGAIGNGASGV